MRVHRNTSMSINGRSHILCGDSPIGGDVDLRIRRDVLAEKFLFHQIT